MHLTLIDVARLSPHKPATCAPWFTKLTRIMRITAFLLLIFCLHVSAKLSSQTLTISGKNIPLVQVFSEIKSQTGFVVFFNYDLIQDSKMVSLDVVKSPLKDVLDLVLKGQALDYEIENRSIVISRKKVITEVISAAEPVAGTVRNAQGQALPKVTIQIKGKPVSVTTDEKGGFTLNARDGDVLVISSVGYTTREVAVHGQEKINIVLQIKNEQLDEANVVAYGTTTRREATGAVSTIKGKALEGVPAANIADLLQGRVAGLDVTNISGSPGSGGTAITIRGYNSLDVEQGRRFSNPLWVVDGVPLNSFTSPVTGTNLLSDLNPDMIESIQILKDASAASLYGSRAANGVIIVTTKKGQKDQKANFSLNVSQSYNILPRLPTVTTGNAERNLRLQALMNDQRAYLDPQTQRYVYPTSPLDVYLNPTSLMDYFFQPFPTTANGLPIQDSLNPFYNNSTNFFPAYYGTGKATNANVQTYGGSKAISYGMGLGYYNEEGVLKGTGFERVDLNSNLDVSPADRLHVDLRLNASLTNRKRGDKSDVLGSSPPIETVPGDPFMLSTLLPGDGSVAWNNIINKISGIQETNRSVRLRSNFKLSYDFLPGLTASSSLAEDYAIERRNNFTPSYLSESGYSRSEGQTGINLLVLNENLLTYKLKIKNDHSINVIGGFSYEYDQQEYNGGYADNSPSDQIFYSRPGFPLLGTQTSNNFGQTFTQTIALQNYQSDMTEKKLISYFGRLEYNYKLKYLLSASFRRDGSSVFGANNKWGAFPSVAGAWSFSEENFVKKMLPWINFGKFRASWGRSGMQFDQPYLALGILQTGSNPYLGTSVLVPDLGEGLYNQNLSWEQTDQTDLGLDLELLDNRLSITGDYYYRYTDRLLLPIRLPGTYNAYLAQWRNAAAVSNEGVELLVNYEVIRRPKLHWKVTFNASRNWNRFEKSNNGQDITAETAVTMSQWIIGKPLNGIYALKTNGYINSQKSQPIYYNAGGVSNYFGAAPSFYYKPGDYNFVDVNGDGVLSSKDVVYAGSALPIVSGGFGSELRLNNFEVNLLFSFQLGRHMVNTTPVTSLATNEIQELLHPILMDVGKATFYPQAGVNASYATQQYDVGSGIYNPVIDRNVETVNWMKLKTVVLRYTVPTVLTKKWKMEAMQVFLSGENLFTVTNYSGLDPETVNIATGIDGGMNYPLARKFTMGLTFKF
jgi:TonB-dependent starch-binding outer membrane protein SusC